MLMGGIVIKGFNFEVTLKKKKNTLASSLKNIV